MTSSGASAVDSLLVICGPTAAGKSAVAMRFAAELGGAIVSADSRQVYRGFDIGTAKPTAEDRQRVPHFGIDLVEPEARYSAAEWAAGAHVWIERARAMGREPLVVGGTGFYLRALFQPLFEAPVLDPARRRTLESWLGGMTTDELQRWCEILDPERARLGRAQLLRAIETALLSGERISVLQRTRSRAPRHAARYLVVDPGPSLAGEISARVDRMLREGWLEEVRELAARVPADAPAWTATGYAAMRQAVSGATSLAEARTAVVTATRRYARRQRTWFRHQLGGADVYRLDPRDPDAFARAMTWWKGED